MAFCREYVVDHCGTQAAIRAGYSPRSAARNATRMLLNPLVKAEIQARTNRLSVKADVTIERVLTELARIAFVDMTKFAPKVVNGRIVMPDVGTLTDDQRSAVSGVEADKSGVKVKSWDKVKALELLGKYLALFVDRTELTGNADTPLVVVQPRGVKG